MSALSIKGYAGISIFSMPDVCIVHKRLFFMKLPIKCLLYYLYALLSLLPCFVHFYRQRDDFKRRIESNEIDWRDTSNGKILR